MKYDSKIDRRRLLGVPMRAILALVLVGLLVVPIAVQADLKVLRAVDAWDFDKDRWENGNVIIPWTGSWIPFVHELYFDGDLWPGTNTPWAGRFFYGLYHEDDAPLGAPGFQESKSWSLVNCDIYDSADPYDRGTVYTECLPSTSGGTHCIVEEQDQEIPCQPGNCLFEIVTTILVNLDLDGVPGIDPLFPADPSQICFYALARTPTPDQVETEGMWEQTLQARVSQGLEEATGDRTVSFALEPDAVELAAFDAIPQENGVLVTWETASEIDTLGFNIYRAESQVGQLIKINPNMIASQNLGSTVGAAYSFLDGSVVPGATYYYWLEDIDASGTATKQGPVTAKVGAARALPGRQRPAPMPANAF